MQQFDYGISFLPAFSLNGWWFESHLRFSTFSTCGSGFQPQPDCVGFLILCPPPNRKLKNDYLVIVLHLQQMYRQAFESQ